MFAHLFVLVLFYLCSLVVILIMSGHYRLCLSADAVFADFGRLFTVSSFLINSCTYFAHNLLIFAQVLLSVAHICGKECERRDI